MVDANSMDASAATEHPTGKTTVEQRPESPSANAGEELDSKASQEIEKTVHHWKNSIILDEREARTENINEWLKLLQDAVAKAGLREADLNRFLRSSPRIFVEALYEERTK